MNTTSKELNCLRQNNDHLQCDNSKLDHDRITLERNITNQKTKITRIEVLIY